MNKTIEKIYKDIVDYGFRFKEYGVRILSSEEQYVKKSLVQAYLAGKIVGLKEGIKITQHE